MRTPTIVAAVMTTACTLSHAEVVIASQDGYVEGGTHALFDHLTLGWGLWIDGRSDLPENLLFLVPDTLIGTADIGTSWTAAPVVTAQVLAQLADDDDLDELGWHRYLDGPWGEFENYAGHPESLWLPTFDRFYVAAQTDLIRLTLIDLTISSPGDDPWGDGVWTDWSMQYRFDFIAIPGPATLFVLGLPAIPRRRTRHL